MDEIGFPKREVKILPIDAEEGIGKTCDGKCDTGADGMTHGNGGAREDNTGWGGGGWG